MAMLGWSLNLDFAASEAGASSFQPAWILGEPDLVGNMRKNVASQTIQAQLVSATDGSNVTTGTTTVYVSIDGAAQTSVGSATHLGNGCWTITPSQANTNGDHLAFTFVNTSAVTRTINIYTVSYNPHDTDDLGLTALTGHTPQTGDSYAVVTNGTYGLSALDTELGTLATAAALATVDANVDAILVDTGTTLPATLATAAALATVDTNVDTLVTRVPQTLNLTASGNIGIDWANVENPTTILDLASTTIDTDQAVASVSSTVTANMAQIAGNTQAATNLKNSASTIVNGTATGTPTTTTMAASALTEATNDHYNGRIIIWTSGALKDQATNITDYDGATKTFTFTAVTEAPSASDTFVIV